MLCDGPWRRASRWTGIVAAAPLTAPLHVGAAVQAPNALPSCTWALLHPMLY